MSITMIDVKLIAKSVLVSLDLDYVVFDVAEDSDPGTWKLTFFDGSRRRGGSLFQIPVIPTATYPEDVVRDEVRRQLTSRLGTPVSHRSGPSEAAIAAPPHRRDDVR